MRLIVFRCDFFLKKLYLIEIKLQYACAIQFTYLKILHEFIDFFFCHVSKTESETFFCSKDSFSAMFLTLNHDFRFLWYIYIYLEYVCKFLDPPTHQNKNYGLNSVSGGQCELELPGISFRGRLIICVRIQISYFCI